MSELITYEIELPNGNMEEISATTERAALRIAADYWMIPAQHRRDMKASPLPKKIPDDVI